MDKSTGEVNGPAVDDAAALAFETEVGIAGWSPGWR